MASTQLSDLDHAKKGVAILATCIVQTLNEGDKTFEGRFLKRLSESYYELKSSSKAEDLKGMELIQMTRELLMGWNLVTGQEKKWLEDYDKATVGKAG